MKPMGKLTVMLTAIMFILSLASTTSFAADNYVDWEKGVIRATGMAAGKAGQKKLNIARAQARRAARMDAERNLAEQIEGVQISSESSMKDLMLQYDIVRASVVALIRNMQEVGEPKYYDDGVCELVLEVPIWGGFSSLSSAAFLPFKEQSKVAFPQPTIQTETTTTITTTTTTNTIQYTGLIIDCSGLNLQPVMSPVIKNTNGQLIYGYENLDYDKVVSMGMASYIRNLNDAAVSRAGDNPIVIKALSVDNFNSNPVITVSDSDSILIANRSAHFLDNCAVVFVR